MLLIYLPYYYSIYYQYYDLLLSQRRCTGHKAFLWQACDSLSEDNACLKINERSFSSQFYIWSREWMRNKRSTVNYSIEYWIVSVRVTVACAVSRWYSNLLGYECLLFSRLLTHAWQFWFKSTRCWSQYLRHSQFDSDNIIASETYKRPWSNLFDCNSSCTVDFQLLYWNVNNTLTRALILKQRSQ